MRSWSTSLLIALVVLALAGCGGAHKKHDHTGGTRGSTTQTTASTPPKAIATALDTVPYENGPQQFRVSIYDLRRHGPFLVLDFGVTCLTPSSGCQTAQQFSPGGLSSNNQPFDFSTMAGVTLIDPTALKQYKAVLDSQSRPYTSTFNDLSIPVSQTFLQWVRYPAPPAGTTALDVTLPNGGAVIPNVPITRGPGPAAGGQFQPAQPAPFAQGPDSTNTSGLTLPVVNLSTISGNSTSSDNESPGQAQLTLHSDVLFQFDKSNLTPRAKTILSAVAQQIKTRARGTVQITGYTDSIGSDAVNIPLSKARAAAVVSDLTPLTPGINYSASGKGSANPVAPNTKPDGSDNPAGRALNRRVTIAFAATPTRPAPPVPASGGPGATPAGQSGTTTFTPPDADTPFRVSGASAYRHGNLMVLTATIACASSSSSSGCAPGLALGGTVTVPPQPLLVSGGNSWIPLALDSLSGFYVLDPTTGAEFIPVWGSDGAPVTANLNVDFVKVGDSYHVWWYFPAPPASTTSLTLVSPGSGGRIAGVPIAGSTP